MLRFIRIGMLVLSLTVCVVLIALWVRSYRVEDRVSGHASNTLGIRFYSSRGWIVCCKNTAAGASQNYPWAMHIGADFWLQPNDSRLSFALPRAFFNGPAFTSASVPHWSAALACGLVAAISASVPHRFSLRTLLIATTLVAVALGTIAAVR